MIPGLSRAANRPRRTDPDRIMDRIARRVRWFIVLAAANLLVTLAMTFTLNRRLDELIP